MHKRNLHFASHAQSRETVALVRLGVAHRCHRQCHRPCHRQCYWWATNIATDHATDRATDSAHHTAHCTTSTAHCTAHCATSGRLNDRDRVQSAEGEFEGYCQRGGLETPAMSAFRSLQCCNPVSGGGCSLPLGMQLCSVLLLCWKRTALSTMAARHAHHC